MTECSPIEVGLISDTHGLLRPEALTALRGVALILHAGDIGGGDIIRELERLAPVCAVCGNIDHEEELRRLPAVRHIRIGDVRLILHHGHHPAPDARAANVVVCGHTHRPGSEWRDGVLCVNPGSAGPRRRGFPVSVARLTLYPHGEHEVRLIELA